MAGGTKWSPGPLHVVPSDALVPGHQSLPSMHWLEPSHGPSLAGEHRAKRDWESGCSGAHPLLQEVLNEQGKGSGAPSWVPQPGMHGSCRQAQASAEQGCLQSITQSLEQRRRASRAPACASGLLAAPDITRSLFPHFPAQPRAAD